MVSTIVFLKFGTFFHIFTICHFHVHVCVVCVICMLYPFYNSPSFIYKLKTCCIVTYVSTIIVFVSFFPSFLSLNQLHVNIFNQICFSGKITLSYLSSINLIEYYIVMCLIWPKKGHVVMGYGYIRQTGTLTDGHAHRWAQCISICQHAHLSVCPSVCMPICVHAHLSVCLFV